MISRIEVWRDLDGNRFRFAAYNESDTQVALGVVSNYETALERIDTAVVVAGGWLDNEP